MTEPRSTTERQPVRRRVVIVDDEQGRTRRAPVGPGRRGAPRARLAEVIARPFDAVCAHCGAAVYESRPSRWLHVQTQTAPCVPSDADYATNPMAVFRHTSNRDGAVNLPCAAEPAGPNHG